MKQLTPDLRMTLKASIQVQGHFYKVEGVIRDKEKEMQKRKALWVRKLSLHT